MTTLVVPSLDEKPWPSLGRQVCAFIEDYLVFGPGDLRGQPARIDAEKRALIYRMYEVYPPEHSLAGRRRYKRVAISVRKGLAKTELMAWIAACELHPEGPVRCDGFDARGEPVGVGVTDPYIPMVAYTEEQSEELAYGALRVILQYSQLADDFDIGLGRIMRIGGDGKAEALATAPNARDGARTTLNCFDETHRLTLPNQKAAHRTMLANIPKRKLADPWSLEITTAPAPGEGSVAEDTMDYARAVATGKITDSRLFYFHRQAGDDHQLDTEEDIRAAVIEASGTAAEWSDIDGIVDQWKDPTADKSYLRRVWLNQLVQPTQRAFDTERWKELADPEAELPEDGESIVLGFDGARYHDATGIVATHIVTGYQWVVGVWEQPLGIENWEVPVAEVEGVIAEAFARWNVWRMYCDPPYWESMIAQWSGQYGEKRVIEWWTTRPRQMAYALKSFHNAIQAGELSHDGSQAYARHIGNACRRLLGMRDDEEKPLWTIYKERSDSPHKIDLCMAGVLSWEARNDALASGVGERRRSAYADHGLMVV